MKEGRHRFKDLRKAPSYRISEAAHYLCIPVATLRSWVLGQRYGTGAKAKWFKPVIEIAQADPPLLSFINLVEAHVLDAIRRRHRVSLQKVRIALDFLGKHFPSRHPLSDQSFMVGGMDIFIQAFGQLVNVTGGGQIAIRQLLEAHLRRVERDTSGVPIRLFPFTRKHDPEEPKRIVIDPSISFGRPVVFGTGVPTSVIAERYKAGESVDELADDYGRERLEIEEAIRCELQLEAA